MGAPCKEVSQPVHTHKSVVSEEGLRVNAALAVLLRTLVTWMFEHLPLDVRGESRDVTRIPSVKKNYTISIEISLCSRGPKTVASWIVG